jgi:heme A synthase
MKIVFRTVTFHIICIIIFALLYFQFENEFGSLDNSLSKKNKNILDFFLFSTTIQAGVGISEFYPSSSLTKILMILQQILMITTHVFTLYFLNL